MAAADLHPPTQVEESSPAALLAAGDLIGLMRACHDRRLEREGISMVLGLADERGATPANTSRVQLAEGASLADQFDRYVAALVPFARDNDEGAAITAMQVLAFTHFAPGGAPITVEEGTARADAGTPADLAAPIPSPEGLHR